MNMMKESRKYFFASVFCVSISVFAAVSLQFVKGQVLDLALAGETRSLERALVLLGLILVEMVFFYFYNILRARYTSENLKILRKGFFSRLMTFKPWQLGEKTRGDYLARYTKEIDLVASQYYGSLPLLFEIGLKAALVSLALFILDFRVALLAIFFITTPLYIPRLFEKRLWRAREESLKSFEGHLGQLVEWLANFRLIYNYQIEKAIEGRFSKTSDKAIQSDYRYKRVAALVSLISGLLSYMAHFVVLAYSAYLVYRGSFSPGDFFIALGMIEQLSYPILALSQLIQDRTALAPTRDKLVEFIQEKKIRGEILSPARLESLALEDLGLYEGDRLLFQGLNLKVKERDKLLILGKSGRGKTSLFNLIKGYRQADEGSILINGSPLEEVGDIRSLLSVSEQDPQFLRGSLRDNLSLYGKVADEAMIEALKKVGLEDLATSQGLDRWLEEEGANLSGGEKKRISLARALLRKAPLLLLDEPLAGLDPGGARIIEELILKEERTSLVISHSFERREEMDQVLEL